MITENDKIQIINLYKQGVTYQEIGDKFGVTKGRISQIIHRAGFKKHNKNLLHTYDDVVVMYNMYLNGCKVDKIAKLYNIARSSVYKLFAKYEFELEQDRKYVYKINNSYFDNIDTPNKAYILGLLWADGSNCTKNNTVGLTLQEKDKHILDEISIEMESDRPLYFKKIHETNPKKQNCYSFTIYNRHISERLMEYGMYPNKTYILKWPNNLDNKLVSHFLRGFTDGDGTIGHNRLGWVGTIMMMEKIQSILHNVFNVEVRMEDTDNNVIKRLLVCRRKDIKQVLDWLYKDADMKLERKYQKYLESFHINNSYSN